MSNTTRVIDMNQDRSTLGTIIGKTVDGKNVVKSDADGLLRIDDIHGAYVLLPSREELRETYRQALHTAKATRLHKLREELKTAGYCCQLLVKSAAQALSVMKNALFVMCIEIRYSVSEAKEAFASARDIIELARDRYYQGLADLRG